VGFQEDVEELDGFADSAGDIERLSFSSFDFFNRASRPSKNSQDSFRVSRAHSEADPVRRILLNSGSMIRVRVASLIPWLVNASSQSSYSHKASPRLPISST
jgi:hypothetical protein